MRGANKPRGMVRNPIDWGATVKTTCAVRGLCSRLLRMLRTIFFCHDFMHVYNETMYGGHNLFS